jgi:hypothetical protein
MFISIFTLWLGCECDARRVKLRSLCEIRVWATTKSRQPHVYSPATHDIDCSLLPCSGKCRALFEVSRVQAVRSTLTWANAVLRDVAQLPGHCTYLAAARNPLVLFSIPNPLNFCLNHRSRTTTTMMFMKPRLVITGVMYTKTCW